MARKKSKSSSKQLPKDSVRIKTSSTGCRFTGAYSNEISRDKLNELKSKDREVIINKESLSYLLPSSYEVLKTSTKTESKSKSEEVPKEGDSATKSEDKS